MRELEFLPAWYGQVRRRKRVVVFQGWILFLLVMGTGTWVLLAQRNVAAAELSLRWLRGQLTQTQSEQKMLDEQLRLRKQLQDQELLIASLGYPVEMTRLLQTLDSLMPKEMSLTEFSCDTLHEPRAPIGSAVARAGGTQEKLFDRKLKVRLVGVAPSDVDVANFLAGLTNIPFFEQVAPKYTSPIVESGHVLREFEVNFWINLDQPIGN